MNPKDLERFYSLRERVFTLIRAVDDGYHKSYEGAMDVRFCFDNIYETKNVCEVEYVEIELHCYLLVNGRHITFHGKTFSAAMDSFERWLKEQEEWYASDRYEDA